MAGHLPDRPGPDGSRTPWASRLGELAAAGVDLVLARGCAGCGSARALWCADCDAALGEGFVAWPTPRPPGLPTPYAVAPYEGAVRAALLAHKEDGRLALARPLGTALATAVRAAVANTAGPAAARGRAGVLGLVPAPSRRSAVRARGHDATLRLARVAAAALRRDGVVVRVAPVLAPVRRLADQSGLTVAARQTNLGGALCVPRRLRPLVDDGSLIVVDDLITTGATLAEATRALTAAGGAVIAAATVAATVRTGSDVVGRSG